MSFKRSNEGRVFFQTLADDNKETAPVKDMSQPLTQASSAPKRDATQMQIITLLKALNARLQASQSDKDALHKEIEAAKAQLDEMQTRALKNEDKAKELEKALAQKGTADSSEAKKAEALAQEALKELKATRKMLAEIEGRAGRNEQALKQHEAKLRESEERLLQQSTKLVKDASEGSKDLEKRLKIAEEVARENERDLEKRLSKAEKAQNQIDKRLDEVFETNEKLDRKIEQAIQERSRLLRKLERIEETVMQTNDALNARAMVLLTDQAAAAQSGAPQIQANLTPQMDADLAAAESADARWWQRKWKVDAFSATTAIVVVLLIGWGVSEMQRPQLPEFDSAQWGRVLNEVDVAAGGETQSDTFSDVAEAPLPYQEQSGFLDSLFGKRDAQLEKEEAEIPQDDDVVAENEAPENANDAAASSYAPVDMAGQDDLGMIDVNNPEQLEALLAEDPAKLAAILNDIEPSTPAPDQGAAANDIANLETVMQPSALNEADLRTPENYELPEAPQTPLAERISADNNLPEAIQDIQAQAFAGSPEAQHDLAAIYTAGHGGVKQNYKRAAQWFEEAAYNGIANAQYNLGVMYHQGIGVQKNTDSAFRWYHAAAEDGHVEAQYNLGIAYIEGIGVPYDAQRAASYFENAAQGGVMEAAYNLGLIYENGLLGEAKPDRALVWYKKAADKGSPEAKAALEMLAKTLGISLDDVKRIADNAQSTQKKTDSAAVVAKEVAAAPVKAPQAPRSFMPPMDDATLMIAQVQEQLMQRGLYPGPADGINGMLTRDAIRTYQTQNGLDRTGEITADLLDHMRSKAAPSVNQTGSIIFDDAENEMGSRE